MSDLLNYPRGSVIQFTQGEYSDFRTAALVVTIVDCDLPELARQFWQQERERIAAELAKDADAKPDKPSCEDFPAWLIANGHAMPADSAEVHLGSYGDFEAEFGVSQ